MTEIVLPQQAVSQGTVVEQSRAVAEVAAAVRVAQDFPRDETRAVEQMKSTCSRLSVAQRAFYEVPNRGAGLSIHAARELARIWGNCDYGVRELRRDDEHGVSEMQVWAWDQETNVRSTRSFIQPHERMKGKARTKLTDLSDIYLNNQNVGARAVRECIFSMLPGWFVAEAEGALRATLQRGDGKPVTQRRLDAIAAFAEHGVTEAQLEDYIGRKSGQWALDHLAKLARAHASITVDGIPVTEFFPEQVAQLPEVTA
ncbi:MAG TPA: hypothetical protein VFU07_07270 [Candidatus Lumbricidophila sp.]|nr:hypothetical protein [Candidatus Lumbricidophila sp.]